MDAAQEVEVLMLDSSTGEALKRDVYDGPTECPLEDMAKEGSVLSIHYRGTIDEVSRSGTPGSEFDTSHERGKPLKFTLGRRQVISGWDKGLMGVCKGAQLTLIVPPQLAYGDDSPSEGIPSGATLNFDVEVVDVKPAATARDVFIEIDTDGDRRLNPFEVKSFFAERALRAGRRPRGSIPKELWEREDPNNDGFIDFEEFTGFKAEL